MTSYSLSPDQIDALPDVFNCNYADIDQHYNGQSMGDSVCVGVITDDPDQTQHLMAVYIAEIAEEDLPYVSDTLSPHVDDFGRRCIVYWRNIVAE